MHDRVFERIPVLPSFVAENNGQASGPTVEIND